MSDDRYAEYHRLVADLQRVVDELNWLRFQGQPDGQLLRDRLAECLRLMAQSREVLSRRRQSVH